MAASTQPETAERLPPVHTEYRDIESLIEENRQLRELVIYLSKLVIKNVTDQKRMPSAPALRKKPPTGG
jgi:hypothetical protein